ncbi:DNA mismatch repair protein MutT [Pradoshia eiseniae]|uniref:DNA mismatch repair protein MutT n=1 Tax=Pradoshia eiseniae TaxID=2064768 RepID=A0A2S7N0L6_9BACI|nr:NUDIX hydrolase [Pradoshia eiseniae]PQD95631.1 DNA mismatch repair protein MutT [Pradoshia eiseniae]
MEKWYGSAAVCMNEHGELLMVLQGRPEERKTWSIPSGGKEQDETFEECCIREVKEETGYLADIIQELTVKKGSYDDLHIAYEIHYFLVKMIEGHRLFNDPDNLIHDIAWKSGEEIKTLSLSYPEDRDYLLNYISAAIEKKE